MEITLPITMGLPMGVTWPATPPMTRAHTRRGKKGGKASPNKSTDSGFSDSEASSSPGGSKENFLSRLHFNRKEVEHTENVSSLSTSKNAKDPKNAGGKSKGELSRWSKGSSAVPTVTKRSNSEKPSSDCQPAEYESGTGFLQGSANTCAAVEENNPRPNQALSISSGSASISLPLSSPVFSHSSERSFQNFSETSSTSGDLSSGSFLTQARWKSKSS